MLLNLLLLSKIHSLVIACPTPLLSHAHAPLLWRTPYVLRAGV